MNLTLTRTYEDHATTGTVMVGDKTLCSIELPWIDNETGVSCVPEGVYELDPYNSPTHGPTWILVNAALGVGYPPAHRQYCEIHAANFSRQLLGCIALGLDDKPMYDPATGLVSPAVESSKAAIEYLIETLGAMSKDHMLIIVRG